MDDDSDSDLDDRLNEVLDNIFALINDRGNLTKIQNTLKEYNATHPRERPFDMNMGNDGIDCVCMLANAAHRGQLEYVSWMLENNANPWTRTGQGESVFHMAISQSILYEIKYGDNDTEPPNSSMGVITCLLHHIEDIEKQTNTKFNNRIWEIRNVWQRSPLDYAARKGGSEVLKFFISKGAKINGPLFSTQYGEISDEARGTYSPGRIDQSANLYTQFGTSLLHQAIEYKNKDAFDILMIDGAHTHVYDATGQTPLMCAIKESNFDAVERLIASPGIDISQVHGRRFEYTTEIGSYFKRIDMTIPQTQYKDWTALHVLAFVHANNQSRHIVNVIQMMLNAGASVRMKTADGQNACDIARSNGNATMVAVFDKWEKARILALYMGKHERLGAASRLRHLPIELIQKIDEIDK
jgi:ankyrin repeat protein